MSITENTYIRRLPIDYRRRFFEILDVNDVWRNLAAIITHPERQNEPLYTVTQLNVFESGRRRGTSPSSLLIGDWETRGRNLPTVAVLLDYLVKAELFRAADFVAVQILNGPPCRRPQFGIGAMAIGFEDQLFESPISQPPEPKDDPGPIYGRSTIQSMGTDRSYASSECSVLRVPDQESEGAQGGPDFGVAESSNDSFHLDIDGKGAFGDVYWGRMKVKDDHEEEVAIKIIEFSAKDQFLNELRVMAKYRHPNLLPLFGYSNDNPKYCCLISQFMVNGSLEDRLAQMNGTEPLSWQTRMAIAVGTARGVSYLHNYGEEPLVHRDIKSANILLDHEFRAKVADFGIARIGGDWQKTTKMMTLKISGTCAYMSNEAFRGNVTVKMDTFSFGIVLLELLTGLAPYDPERENSNLLLHVEEEEKSAEEWMDPKAGEWPEKVASQLFDIALRCTKEKMKLRPIIEQVVCELEEITDHL